MKGKIIPIAVAVVVMLMAIWYESRPISVSVGDRTVCDDAEHMENKVISSHVRYVVVRRALAAKYNVSDKFVTCAACRARRDKAEREAQARAEAEAIASDLEIEFSIPQFGRSTQEVKAEPGAPLVFTFTVKNNGTKPISDLKVLIEPGEYLEYMAESSEWPREQALARAGEASLKKLTTIGLPLFRGQGYRPQTGALNPYNDPHYATDRGYWDCDNAAFAYTYTQTSGFMPPGTVRDVGGFGNSLCLARAAKAGEDVTFSGYLVYKGQKIPAGTVTVHVMHPSQ